MANQHHANGAIEDDDLSMSQATEQTPLVISERAPENDDLSFSSGEEGTNTPVSNYDILTASDEELESPWPATFGRSISLLAGPTMDPDFVDVVTKSPKITPYQPLRNRRKAHDKNTNLHTPEFQRQPIGMVQSPDSQMFKQGITKIKSLDFSSGRNKKHNEMSFEHDKRALEAKLYRQKILKQTASPPPGATINNSTGKSHGNKGKTSSMSNDVEAGYVNSPGYQRQKDAEMMSKNTKTDAHGAPISNQKASFSQCVFNMANILMGVGMLSLPFVFKSAGWIGGLFVTFTFSVAAWRTSILLGRELNGDPRPCSTFNDNPFKSPTVPGSSASARMRKPISTFPDIAREAFGPLGSLLLSIVLYFELFSCLCIFLITIGDHLHMLIPNTSVTRHMLHVAIILAIPTALLRTPRLLSYLSAVGTFATIFVVLAVFISAMYFGDISEDVALEQGKTNDDPSHILWRTSGLPMAFGLIAYTFSGHAIVPSIYSSMERPQDFERMISRTFVIVLFCCMVVAISGYYMFGDFVDDQVTLSLEQAAGSDNTAIKLLTWLMILTAFSKFTLTAFPLALGIEEIFAPFLSTETAMEIASSVIKLVLIVLAFIVAVFVPSFSFVCSLVGLICTMIVSIIFPAGAHLKLFGPQLPWWEKAIDYFFVISGIIMGIVGTIVTIKG